jgi:membrane protease YdiL (CAAX protease family)
VRTPWWTPIVVALVMGVIMLGAQVVLITIATIIDAVISGRVIMEGLTPLGMLAANLSLALLLPLALLALRWIAGVPWKAALSAGRPFSWKRLGTKLLHVFAVFAVVLTVAGLISPEALLGPHGVRMGSLAIAYVVVALLTTPLQAAAEETLFRGTLLPLFGSWGRGRAGLAVGIGLAISSLLFGLAHGATDPWLALYYTGFGFCAGLMAVFTGGIEASIAFHVVNNVIFMVLGALSAGDQIMVIDRSAAGGAGGPWVLLILALDLFVVLVVAIPERRRSRNIGDTPESGPQP